MKKTDSPIVVEQNFDFSIERIWSALTDVEEMRQWFFDNIPEFKPVVGFKTEFNVKSDQRNFLHKWEITKVDKPELIEYKWNYAGYPGDSTVKFVLTDLGGSTKMNFSMNILEDFPEDIPEFKRESCIAGWEYFIKERLPAYLS